MRRWAVPTVWALSISACVTGVARTDIAGPDGPAASIVLPPQQDAFGRKQTLDHARIESAGLTFAPLTQINLTARGRRPGPERVTHDFYYDSFEHMTAPANGDTSDLPLWIWSTHYYTPIYRAQDSGFPLINRDDSPITGGLSERDWCNVAMQGSATIVEPDGSHSAYVFVDANGPEQVNCDSRMGFLADNIKEKTRRARFSKIDHDYGCGSSGHPLQPFRSVAVDSSVIPYGSTLYAPALKGREFYLGGRRFVHDGYLFAADRGGAVKGNQIDLFTGNSAKVPFTDVVASTSDVEFEVYFVDDDAPAARRLRTLHAGSCKS